MLTGAWVLALLLAGVPLLAMGGGSEADGDDGDDGARQSEDGDAGDTPDPSDGPAPEAEVTEDTGGEGTGDEDALPPTDYEFLLGTGGDHRIDGFRPGTDTLTLTSDGWDFELYDLGDDGTGPAFEIARGEDRSVLRFPGLSGLPLDDVFLRVAEPGAEPVHVPLRDALLPDGEEDTVLAPTDPDAPDTLPDDAGDGDVLAPADPAEPEEPGEDDWSGAVLAPTHPDAPDDRPSAP
jgi:hypothetical protein